MNLNNYSAENGQQRYFDAITVIPPWRLHNTRPSAARGQMALPLEPKAGTTGTMSMVVSTCHPTICWLLGIKNGFLAVFG